MYDWSQMFIDAGETMGQTFKIPERSKRLIEEAGFVDVVEKKYKLPVGGWPADKRSKEIGKWNLLYLLTGLDGMQLWILKAVLGVRHIFPNSGWRIKKRADVRSATNGEKWDYIEIQALSGKMRSALKDKNNHTYYEM
jgi:hypothetical protein